MQEKRLGQAATPGEQAVEEVIRRVPAWAGKEVGYSPMEGGILNSNWRVAVDGDSRRFFVKIPGKGSEMFVNRAVANEAARSAHALGIGPEVVFFDPSDGVEVCEFLEGYRASTNNDFLQRDVQLEVMALYRRLHKGDRLSLTKTVFDMIDEHMAQAEELGSDLPKDFAWLRAQYANAKAAMTASGLDIVPCFNDPMPGNFLLRDGDPIRLIDYEFASNNERSFELGALFTEMFYPEDKALELIEAYYGEARRDYVARVHVTRCLADIKWACWSVVNRKLSSWDFDYQKYGDWKFMRARSVIFDPRWEWWLRVL